MTNHWFGQIHGSHTNLFCQTVHIYGDQTSLVESIPQHLHIQGRLTTVSLWDYVQRSLPLRDILILTLTCSSNDPRIRRTFSQYVERMCSSKHANVIAKYPQIKSIRTMYVLAADTKDCPTKLLSTFFLPNSFESKQLFLIILGSDKKEISTKPSIQYKPITSQTSSSIKDPRLNRNTNHNNNKPAL